MSRVLPTVYQKNQKNKQGNDNWYEEGRDGPQMLLEGLASSLGSQFPREGTLQPNLKRCEECIEGRGGPGYTRGEHVEIKMIRGTHSWVALACGRRQAWVKMATVFMCEAKRI